MKKWLFDDGFGEKSSKAPENVEIALKKAFEALDESIVWDRESSFLCFGCVEEGGRKWKLIASRFSGSVSTAVRLLARLPLQFVVPFFLS